MSVESVSTNTQTSSSATTQSQTTTNASQSATLDYNAFLTLLTAQLKNQDPTNPQDATEFMSQLASFSTVEQQIKSNNKLDSLITSMTLGQAEGFIGRQLTNADGSVSGKVVSVNIISGGAVAVLEGGQEISLAEGVKVS